MKVGDTGDDCSWDEAGGRGPLGLRIHLRVVSAVFVFRFSCEEGFNAHVTVKTLECVVDRLPTGSNSGGLNKLQAQSQHLTCCLRQNLVWC